MDAPERTDNTATETAGVAVKHPDFPATFDPRIQFAAERTLLAWVRTGLALMGFGFVVARFGIFLRELAASKAVAARHPPGLSLWLGTALICLGVFILVSATFSHRRTIQKLKRHEFVSFHPSIIGVSLAITLAVIGGALAAYLIGSRFGQS